MALPEVTVKGTAFLGTIKFVKSQPRGDALLEKIIAQLSADHAKIFQRKVIAIGNYPYPLYIELIRAVDKMVGKGDFGACRRMGMFSAKRDYESIYNLYKQSPRPEDLFRDCNVIWRSYYENAGEMKAEDGSPDHLEIRILGFPAMDPAHCKMMEGWMSQALIESGGQWVQDLHEAKCPHRGDDFHQYVGKWKKAG